LLPPFEIKSNVG